VIYRLPPLNALRVFEAAARHLSFKDAAVELHITQAAVSHQIKALEEYLGVELFRRAGRGVTLTDAARACLPKLREGFDSLAAAVEMIREKGDAAELVITAPPVFTARWLMPRLADFSKREPKIELRVFASSKMVDAGALDSTALVGDLDLRTESSAVQIHLGAGEYAGHRADRLFGVSMAAVANPALVKGEPGLKKPADADEVDATRGPHFSSNILSLEAASQNLGVALALRPLVDADIASGRLCEPFEAFRVKPQSAYYLVCPEVIADRPAVIAFRKWLLEQVQLAFAVPRQQQ